MTELDTVQCGRCKRHRPRHTTDAPHTALTGWCLDQTQCLAASLVWVREITLDALAESVFQFMNTHQRAEGVSHHCGMVGSHSLHICECGWVWTSNAMTHTAYPPEDKAVPEDIDQIDRHTATSGPGRHHEVINTGPGIHNATGEPMKTWPLFEAAPPPPLFAVHDAGTAAPTSGPPTDPRSKLVGILANLHDLSEQVRSIVEGHTTPPWLDNPQAAADIVNRAPLDTPGLTIAKVRRNRLNTVKTGILPAERPIEPWCRVCGNYTADPRAFEGDLMPVCADRGACTGRLIHDAHILAGLSYVDTLS